ncbi:MAG TPA: PH domain-containing protein [Demequinaceae bacterium]
MTSQSFAPPEEWTRLHIVTPVLLAGRAAGVFVVVALAQGGQGGLLAAKNAPAWVPLAGIVIVIAVASAIAFGEWWMNQFRVDDDAVHQRKGILFRQYRQARLDRLQAVDVVQPLVARVFGFAEVKIDVAGGKASSVRLQYLRLEDAQALRNEIVALAAGIGRAPVGASVATAPPREKAGPALSGEPILAPVSHTPALPAPASQAPVLHASARREPVGAAPQREVYAVPPGRLVGSIVASWWTLFIVGFALVTIIVVVVMGAVAVRKFAGDAISSGGGIEGFLSGGAYGVLSGLFAFFAVGWARFSSGFGFTAAISADGIRLQHGLLDTRHQTVPPGRVQAVRLRQGLPWRRFDWWRITINVAGYQDEEQAETTLLPVGPRRDALYALWLVLPDLGDPDPAGTVSAALSGVGADNGFTATPRRAWLVDPLQWRRRGVLATGRALLIRQGLFARDLVVVPHEKTQSLSIRQGPLQRLLSLASVEVHSTKGSISPVAHHLDVADAIALVDAQADRAREARGRQSPEQWMATVQR